MKIILSLCLLTASYVFTTEFAQGKSSILASQTKKAEMLLSNGKKLDLTVVTKEEDQIRGLSGKRSNEFGANEGMFFFYLGDSQKGFWMPDTYFDLDILFLDKDLKVLHIERQVKAHPGLKEPPAIAQTPVIHCRHVLEVRSDSKVADGVKKGDILKWLGPTSLKQIESETLLSK
jgi:uncharacterized membrane protein (UPF0127 family)